MNKEKQPDPRIGRIGHYDTKLCAVSGKASAAGMVRYRLREDYYFRVHAQYQRDVTDELKAALAAILPDTNKTRGGEE